MAVRAALRSFSTAWASRVFRRFPSVLTSASTVRPIAPMESAARPHQRQGGIRSLGLPGLRRAPELGELAVDVPLERRQPA